MRLLIFLITLLSLLLPQSIGQAETTVAQTTSAQFEIKELQASYEFGRNIHFSALLAPPEVVQAVYLMIQPQGVSTQVYEIPPTTDGQVTFNYDLTATILPPFSPVEYWLRVSLASGEQVESPRQTLLYEDNRFAWQVIEDQNMLVKWYSGDLAFGQAVLDVAKEGMTKALELVNAEPPQPLRIYVYPTASDLQTALALVNSPWVAGHASPEFATLLVSLAPGATQRLEMERQLPHEITHILLYQAYGEHYSRLPQWLNEGLASLSELYPNTEYKRVLQKAGQSNALLPMESLCSAFPRESSGAYLAYAQSESFTRFLSQKFGNPSLQKLSSQYADGLDCLQGVQTVYGSSLSQLEQRWKQEYLGMDAGLLAWQSLLPYILLLLVVLIPLIIGGVWLWRKK